MYQLIQITTTNSSSQPDMLLNLFKQRATWPENGDVQSLDRAIEKVFGKAPLSRSL